MRTSRSLSEVSEMKIAVSFSALALTLLLVACAAPPEESFGRYPARERVEERPASTPTPIPHAPIYVPLDPAGQPQ
jgi:hypothetical protein